MEIVLLCLLMAAFVVYRGGVGAYCVVAGKKTPWEAAKERRMAAAKDPGLAAWRERRAQRTMRGTAGRIWGDMWEDINLALDRRRDRKRAGVAPTWGERIRRGLASAGDLLGSVRGVPGDTTSPEPRKSVVPDEPDAPAPAPADPDLSIMAPAVPARGYCTWRYEDGSACGNPVAVGHMGGPPYYCEVHPAMAAVEQTGGPAATPETAPPATAATAVLDVPDAPVIERVQGTTDPEPTTADLESRPESNAGPDDGTVGWGLVVVDPAPEPTTVTAPTDTVPLQLIQQVPAAAAPLFDIRGTEDAPAVVTRNRRGECPMPVGDGPLSVDNERHRHEYAACGKPLDEGRQDCGGDHSAGPATPPSTPPAAAETSRPPLALVPDLPPDDPAALAAERAARAQQGDLPDLTGIRPKGVVEGEPNGKNERAVVTKPAPGTCPVPVGKNPVKISKVAAEWRACGDELALGEDVCAAHAAKRASKHAAKAEKAQASENTPASGSGALPNNEGNTMTNPTAGASTEEARLASFKGWAQKVIDNGWPANIEEVRADITTAGLHNDPDIAAAIGGVEEAAQQMAGFGQQLKDALEVHAPTEEAVSGLGKKVATKIETYQQV